MRFVAVKSEEQQAAALVFRTRDLAVKQRTQIANAIRGHLAEYGWVAPRGAAHLAMLADLLEDGEIGQTLPEAARPMFAMMIDMLANLDKRIAELDKEITRRAREDEVARRLMTIPGVGPITATAIAAIAPAAETFAKSAKSGGRGDSWLMALAEALGRKLDRMANEMADMADWITDKTPSATAKFSAKTQEFGILMNAATNAIKTIGEAEANTARKG